MNTKLCNETKCPFKWHNRKNKATCKAAGERVRVKYLTGCPMRDKNFAVMSKEEYAEYKRNKAVLTASN